MTDTSMVPATPAPRAKDDTVALTAYVDHAYESVCAVFEQWSGTTRGDYTIGELTKPSTFVARIPIGTADRAIDAELRALPVWTGCNSVTELLLVVSTHDDREHARTVEIGRHILDALARDIGEALEPSNQSN